MSKDEIDFDLSAEERKSSFDNPGDVAALLDCIEQGDNKKQMRVRTGFTMKKLNNIIKDLQEKKGVLTHYRGVQSLQLTEMQARVMDALRSEDKIERSSAMELAQIFNILKKNELVLDGKPSEIKGLVTYLIDLEKDETAAAQQVDGSIIDVSGEDIKEEIMPSL